MEKASRKLAQRRRQWQPTPVLLPGKSYGQRSLVGCSPWGRWESDTTERLHFHFSLSCTGEGNGNPLQCSCLENPRDRGAWWAAVSGVAQSRPRMTRLSSSSSSSSSRTLLRLWWPSVLAYRGKGLAVLCLISSCFGDNLENQHLITLCLPLDCDSLYPVYHVPLNSLLLLPIVGSYV